jgi:precorrin-6A/cobalt-precorrin-6A reductase
MILLFGGTSDTAPIAQALADRGENVMVCTATDEPMAIGDSVRISRHCGRLTADQMVELIHNQRVKLIIDATHPYAAEVSQQIQAAGRKSGRTILTYQRPAAIDQLNQLHRVNSHQAAAKLAFTFHKPVLLTTGANNLRPYQQEAERTSIPLTARVLNREESLQNCYSAGLSDSQIIAEKGPFSVEGNIRHLRQANAGVLVVKDSGLRGGIESRLEAARLTGCEVIMIKRPAPVGSHIYTDYQSLIRRVFS